ncbi:MAG: amino acid-binding protein [Hyphomicrobiales bacterium]|nr:MAG: amino acid-binding protein [Hyphomicrobiales bacterium]
MTIEIILTVIAPDRPGLVRSVADTVANNGGNWIDSAMARLGGEFAGIVRVAVPDDKATGLETALEALSEHGISVSIRHNAPSQVLTGSKVHLEVTGQDQAGIVRDVAAALAQHGVSVEELRTRVFAGSMSGEALFSAEAEIIVPDGLELDTVRDALEHIAHDIMVDIEFSEIAG